MSTGRQYGRAGTFHSSAPPPCARRRRPSCRKICRPQGCSSAIPACDLAFVQEAARRAFQKMRGGPDRMARQQIQKGGGHAAVLPGEMVIAHPGPASGVAVPSRRLEISAVLFNPHKLRIEIFARRFVLRDGGMLDEQAFGATDEM